ncbi:MAG: VWA domain-containing protein [Sumerlaeia bacterium]
MSWFPSFLQNPFAWGLLALLPAIVVMYLLKLKRQKVLIPSTLLWRKAMQDMVANSPFQKLRNNLLMWLQLLFLLLLILAFMRPVAELPDSGSQTYIFLVDHSASMHVKEGSETRMNLAKNRVQELVDVMQPEDRAIILGFSDRTNIFQTLTNDKLALRNALRKLEPRDVPTSLSEAGLILQSLTSVARDDGGRAPLENTKTFIVSDGAINGLNSLVDVPNLEFISVGTETGNLGISAVDVRESFGDSFEYQVFVSVTNSFAEEREVLVEFEVDGEIIDIKSTTVQPQASSGVVFRTSEFLDGMATIRLETTDAFPLDDEVKALIAPPSNINILLVTNGNTFLEQVLLIDPRVEVSVTRPTDYNENAEYDIVFFDGAQVGSLLQGNYVFLNSLPPIEGFKESGEMVTNPEIVDWNRVHPLNRYVNFETVLIGQTRNYETPRDTVPILESLETEMISLYETETQKVLVIGFDIFKSYWPLDVSFPIFISNTIDYFSRNSPKSLKPVNKAGSTITLFADKDATSATVTPAEGEAMNFSFQGTTTAYLTNTMNSGVYNVTYDSGTQYQLPVYLLDESESLIAPAQEIQVVDKTILSTGDGSRSNQEIWKWFALAALAFMLIEWFIYCRRTFM